MPSITTVRSFLFLATLLAVAPAWSAAPDCDRACLKGYTDLYFEAMAQHDASRLPVARDVKFTENGERLKLGEGFCRIREIQVVMTTRPGGSPTGW